ncbi:MAG TPA: hypothetical protein VGI20_02260 [Rhizomicrobium sp.]|jgi:hypothetical protein
MKYVVVICEGSDEFRFLSGLEKRSDPDLFSRVCAMVRRPIVRWFAAPILGIPAIFAGYSTMLNFWLALGVSSSLWLHVVAAIAGATGGVAAVARLRA